MIGGEGIAECYLIGVLQIASDRKTAREARHRDSGWREKPGGVHRGCVTFKIGICGQDDLLDVPSLNSRQQLRILSSSGPIPSMGEMAP